MGKHKPGSLSSPLKPLRHPKGSYQYRTKTFHLRAIAFTLNQKLDIELCWTLLGHRKPKGHLATNKLRTQANGSMKRFMQVLLAVMLTPLAAGAYQHGETLAAHGGSKKAAYLVLSLITQEIELIPTENLEQCDLIGKEIMKGGKLSKFLKGYKCVPGLH